MSCAEAPVARRLYADAVARYGGQVSFLGIIGDQSHSVRKSGHNCGDNRELFCTNPGYAHALDIGVGSNTRIGNELVDLLRRDPRVHYVIYRGVGYRPWHRGGGTWAASGHDTHVHTSFGCGTTHDTRPFLGVKKKMTPADRAYIAGLAKKEAAKRPLLEIKKPRMRGRHVRDVQRVVGQPRTGVYGVGTRNKVTEFQKFWKLKETGKVNRETWEMILFVTLAKFFGF